MPVQIFSVGLTSGVALLLAALAPSATAAQDESPRRLLAKLKAPLASEVEGRLDEAGLAFRAGAAPGSMAEAFAIRHSVRSLRPLHAALVRRLRAEGLTEREWVDRVRARFPMRAARKRGAFRPPALSRTYVLELPATTSQELERKLERLRDDPQVEYAEEDHRISVDYLPNDPYLRTSNSWGQGFDDLWGIKNIGAPEAWNRASGAGIVIAVVDTGLDHSHPDMAANVWVNPGETPDNGLDDDANGFVDDVRGWDFVGVSYATPSPDANPSDSHGHGTHVSGTAAAVGNNGIGVVGVAWRSKVMAVKGLDDQGYGLDSGLAQAIEYAATMGADVINNSWGGPGSSPTIADAVEYAHNLGAVVVAAAGNDDADVLGYYPAHLTNTITVAASNPYSQKSSFSNWGGVIDVSAPGEDILSLRAGSRGIGQPVGDRYCQADGTSMAAPHVSGLAALILAAHPGFSNEQVRQAIRASAVDVVGDGVDSYSGYGRIDAAQAVAVAAPLEALIQVPASGAHIASAVTVSGLARGPRFVGYSLEYGLGERPSEWTLISESAGPSDGGPLGLFDPSPAVEGLYTLRLQVVDSAGRVFEDRRPVVLDYVSIASPPLPRLATAATVVKGGEEISITGTALGPSFVRFRLEWAPGVGPATGWSDDGMSVADGGSSPVGDGLLGTWDTSVVSQAGYFTIRVAVENADLTSEARTLVYIEPSLFSPRWPKWLRQGPGARSGPVVSRDASGNNRLRVVGPQWGSSGGIPGELVTYSPDGGGEVHAPIEHPAYMQHAVGDLVASLPGDETVVSEMHGVRVYRSDGHWYPLVPAAEANFMQSPPLLEDIDGDGALEVLARGVQLAQKRAFLFAWRGTGEPLGGRFPIEFPDADPFGATYGRRFLVVDLDGNGTKEIVFAERTQTSLVVLRVFESDGSPRAWQGPDLAGSVQQMVAGDLDHNGLVEIIVQGVGPGGGRAYLDVFDGDGRRRPGWPVGDLWYGSTIAIADMNRDGSDEIIVAAANGLTVLQANGTPLSAGWPAAAARGMSAFAVADVSGDGFPEVVGYVTRTEYAAVDSLSACASGPPPAAPEGEVLVPEGRVGPEGEQYQTAEPIPDVVRTSDWELVRYGELLVVNRAGTVQRSWRLLGISGQAVAGQSNATPLLADVDGNGTLEVALTYQLLTGEDLERQNWVEPGLVTVLETGAPAPAGDADWPSVFHDPRNTAARPRTTDGSPGIRISDAIAIDGPSSRNEEAVFTVSLAWAASEPVVVHYATSDRTARAEEDYVSQAGALTFAPGETVHEIRVSIIGEDKLEADETFSVDLSDSSPARFHIWDWAGVATIQARDLTLSAADASLVEGDSGTSELGFAVTLSGVSPVRVEVDYATADGTASAASDYAATSGTLTFEPGVLQQVIRVSVFGDAESEGNEAFFLSLSAPRNAVVVDGQAQGLIIHDEGPPALSIADLHVLEPAAGTTTTVAFAVSLSWARAVPVTVSYRTVNGKALGPADFVPVSGSLTIPPGLTTGTISVVIRGDSALEIDEGFYVDLSNPTPAEVVISDARAEGTILTRNALILVSNPFVAEGDSGSTSADFEVSLAAPNSLPVTVGYYTANGTALAGSDYAKASGVLTFAPGTTVQTVSVPVAGDTLNEADETFLLVLRAPTNALLVNRQREATVTDDDAPPEVSIRDTERIEGRASTNGAAALEVLLSAPSGQTISVSYATVDGTAEAGSDYGVRSGTLVFPPGVTLRKIAVSISGDERAEGDETFYVDLSNPTPPEVAIADGRAEVRVLTDDVGLSVFDVVVAEESSGAARADFDVSLPEPSSLTVTVRYVTLDGTALSGRDYTAVSGVLTFLPGTTEQTVSVPVAGDTLNEADETFSLVLSSPTNAQLADRRGQATITNDDAPPGVSIGDAERIEGQGSKDVTAVLDVLLSEPSGQTLSVTYATEAGTAEAGSDYWARAGTLVFPPGVTLRRIAVPILGDGRPEGDETFYVALNSTTPAGVEILDGRGEVRILTDDIGLSVSDVVVEEGDSGTAASDFDVSLAEPSSLMVTVGYVTVNGTALAGSDYTTVSGVLTFLPGTTTQTVSVPVKGDTLNEADETFLLTLRTPTRAVLVDRQGQATIANDDGPPGVPMH